MGESLASFVPPSALSLPDHHNAAGTASPLRLSSSLVGPLAPPPTHPPFAPPAGRGKHSREQVKHAQANSQSSLFLPVRRSSSSSSTVSFAGCRLARTSSSGGGGGRTGARFLRVATASRAPAASPLRFLPDLRRGRASGSHRCAAVPGSSPGRDHVTRVPGRGRQRLATSRQAHGRVSRILFSPLAPCAPPPSSSSSSFRAAEVFDARRGALSRNSCLSRRSTPRGGTCELASCSDAKQPGRFIHFWTILVDFGSLYLLSFSEKPLMKPGVSCSVRLIGPSLLEALAAGD
ncbi:uncharacterized protein LOC133501971 [Syngnathoides biaculeatus]|uniref:uncharacterized protein LOC133501971 n=1 Tax=Syngnathoides biaculeatus TaxID=300417 RepID=UPI002ADE14B9|nr:uncharacterized protein LOC133501971 [Syngnathoides biaculeatus]